MSTYVLTDNALRGFEEILEYVQSRFDFEVALQVGARLKASFERVAESPGIGHARSEITDDLRVRFLTVGPSVVAYIHDARPVVILAVERGSKDWSRLPLQW